MTHNKSFCLRPFQARAIETITGSTKCHLGVIAPTGSGKSTIYIETAKRLQIPALLISPLVALNRQHARLIKDHGLESLIEIRSPESVKGLKRAPHFLIVDECHSVLDWGREFRPKLMEIPQLVHHYNVRKSLWLSATFPMRHQRHLSDALKPHLITYQGEFSLPENLHLNCVRIPVADRASWIINFIRQRENIARSGIIFAWTRTQCERLARALLSANINSVFYHAGLSKEERQSIETRVHQGNIVIVATNAFGMGMHVETLDFAILYSPPSSLLDLAQAVGRIGRTQREARAEILWDNTDFKMMEWLTHRNKDTRDDFNQVVEFLNSFRCKNQLTYAMRC